MTNFENWETQLKALSDVTRLKILDTLLKQHLNVDELAAAVRISKYSASRHLRVLRDAGIIRSRKQGRCLVNTITDNFLTGIEKHKVLDLGCCQFHFDTTSIAHPTK